MIVFETERLIVRYFTERDKENYFSLAGDPDVMRYIRAVKDRAGSDAFLEQIIRDSIATPGIGRWAVDEKGTGNFVGSFAIIPIPLMPDKIQLGYSLTTSNWGKGFATELTKGGLDYFLKHHTAPVIYGVTETPNIASQNVLLKAGFTPAGSMMEDNKELLLFVITRDNLLISA